LFGHILVEFLFRLTLGVAVAMGVTPSRQVTSGFYRVHLWVLMGLQTLAALALFSRLQGDSSGGPATRWQFALAIATGVIAYVGAVIWMYERNRAGKMAIWLLAALALAGCILPLMGVWLWDGQAVVSTRPLGWQLADRVTGSLVLGFVTTAMLLGHWYLNTPTMKLAPLQRLIMLLAIAVLIRAAVSGVGTWLEWPTVAARPGGAAQTWLVFVGLRWLAGIVSVLVLAWLTWLTLKIPNTQSATGILYAAVIVAFIGELTSQLLSAEARFPL
jgi:hypothetical protein